MCSKEYEDDNYEIEFLRKKLSIIVKNNVLKDKKTITCSQKLDKLIVESLKK